jgi:hypothetical protein
VLLKVTEEGFILHNSEKRQSDETEPSNISFLWHSMERQVIIKRILKRTCLKSFLIIILIQDQKRRFGVGFLIMVVGEIVVKL